MSQKPASVQDGIKILQVVTFRKKVFDLEEVVNLIMNGLSIDEFATPEALCVHNLVHNSALRADQNPSQGQFWGFDSPDSGRRL